MTARRIEINAANNFCKVANMKIRFPVCITQRRQRQFCAYSVFSVVCAYSVVSVTNRGPVDEKNVICHS